jgi:hypothetical protein
VAESTDDDEEAPEPEMAGSIERVDGTADED